MLDYQFGDHLPVLNHGYVALLDKMGSDTAIVDAARISYDRRGKSADRALLRYLLRHRHTSPFEMAEMKFELKMPIFVARQWVRHRTANMNEMSARYTELPDDFFIPESLAVQSKDNKQGRGEQMPSEAYEDVIRAMRFAHGDSYSVYAELLEKGVARELARGVLPVNIYTKMVWKMDLHNLMHFLHLRLHSHAQEEIRAYAEQIERLMGLYFPMTAEAFRDYIRDSYTCSRMEINMLRELLVSIDSDETFESLCRTAGMSDREIKEFRETFYGT